MAETAGKVANIFWCCESNLEVFYPKVASGVQLFQFKGDVNHGSR